MAVQMIDNIAYRGKKPDNIRSQFNTISEMVAYDERYLPEMYDSFCVQDKRKYRFTRTNESLPELGKWRPIDSSDYVLPTASSSVKGGVKIGTGLRMNGEFLESDAQPVSEVPNNAIELKSDGIYVEKIDTDAFVEKEEGKGLSTNDLTNQLKSRYDAAEQNVQADWEEDDSTADSFVKNKPVNLSAFTNDLEFITNTVNNLTNYYTKTQSYTKAEVQALISAINQFSIIKVEELPTTDINTHAIYLVPKDDNENDDVYNEYLYVDNKWEFLGSTQVDLSNYYTKSEVYNKTESNSIFEGKIWKGTHAEYDALVEPLPPGTKVIFTDDYSQYNTSYIYTCTTAVGTALKQVSAPDIILKQNVVFKIFFANGNTASGMQVKLNGTTYNLRIYKSGIKSSISEQMDAGTILDVFFDGTDLVLTNNVVVKTTSDYTTNADGTIEYVKSKVDSLIDTRAKTKYFELGNVASGASKTFDLNQLGTHDFVIINAYLVNTTFYNLGIIKKSYYNELFTSLSSYLISITLNNGILTITQSSSFELPLMVSFIYA